VTVQECEGTIVDLKPHSDRAFVLGKAAHASLDFADVCLFDFRDRFSISEKADEASLHSLTLVEGVLLLTVKNVILFASCIHGISEKFLPFGSSGIFVVCILLDRKEVSERLSEAQFDHLLKADYDQLRHRLDVLMI